MKRRDLLSIAMHGVCSLIICLATTLAVVDSLPSAVILGCLFTLAVTFGFAIGLHERSEGTRKMINRLRREVNAR